ncbi:hypothetical protein Q6346_05280 [Isoptericola sp. b490]|nr:hypothetical protein [Isoptericola sp. b490]
MRRRIPHARRRPWWTVLVSCVLAAAGTVSLASAAWAHGDGEGETKEGYLLVQQALGYLAHQGTNGIDAALEKIDDTLATTDQEGVDVSQVEAAQGALSSGDVAKGQELLQASITEAVSDLPPAVGSATGTTVIPSDMPGRGALGGSDWVFLGASALFAALGAWLAARLRPADTVRSLRARLGTGELTQGNEESAGMERA